jgi:hypothetical protein
LFFKLKVVKTMFSQSTTIMPITLEDRLKIGNQFWLNGQPMEAFRIFSDALLAFPEDPEVTQRLILLLLSRSALRNQRQGNMDSMIAAWKAFLLLDPQNLNVKKDLAIALFSMGRTNLAEELLLPLLQQTSYLMSNEILTALKSIVESRSRADVLGTQLFQLAILARKVPEVGQMFESINIEHLASSPSLCIAGMHRTGTSMLTRLLSDLGLYLGPATMLHSAQPDNPEGFFENTLIHQLNTDLLTHLGGSWDAPPATHGSVFTSSEFTPFKHRAKLLAAAMAAGTSPATGWGWKDPRTLLTLPFWLEVLPDTRVVVIFRDPGDVAVSLQRRGGYHTPEFGLVLWRIYYERLFAALSDRPFVVVQYEKFFEDPKKEIDRICAFLDWQAKPEQLDVGIGHLRKDLHHNRSQFDWRVIPAGKALEPIYECLVMMGSK